MHHKSWDGSFFFKVKVRDSERFINKNTQFETKFVISWYKILVISPTPTLMTDFAQAFQNDHNISDAVERDQYAAIVKLFRLIAQSHMTFFNALRGSYSQNAFPSPIIRMNPFSHTTLSKSQTTSSERKNFCELRYFIRILAFPLLVSHAIFLNLHQNRVMKPSYCQLNPLTKTKMIQNYFLK